MIVGGTVTVAGQEVSREHLFIERIPIDGTIVESGSEFAVALDTTLSRDLLLEGVARDLVSRVQRLRREAGLDVTDRISLEWWSEDPEVKAAISAHGDLIGAELLASSITEADAPFDDQFDVDGRSVGLRF